MGRTNEASGCLATRSFPCHDRRHGRIRAGWTADGSSSLRESFNDGTFENPRCPCPAIAPDRCDTHLYVHGREGFVAVSKTSTSLPGIPVGDV